MSIKSEFEVIKLEYLSHAEPETVFDWLISNAEEAASSLYGSPFSVELLTSLLNRNHPIINLGLATAATEDEILEKLWDMNNPAIRVAIAGNNFRDRSYWPEPHRWLKEEELLSAFENGAKEFIRAWCTNPVLAREELADLLSKENIYKILPESVFKEALYWALKNPNLTEKKEEDRFASDGWDEYHNSRPFSAAWSLLLTLPNTSEYAILICFQLGKIAEFDAPYESLLKEEKADHSKDEKKWKEQYVKGQRLFLEHVLHRWSSDASDDPKSRDEQGKEHDGFRILRENIAAAIPYFNHALQEFIENHPDVYVRRGYYRSFRPGKIEDLYHVYGSLTHF